MNLNSFSGVYIFFVLSFYWRNYRHTTKSKSKRKNNCHISPVSEPITQCLCFICFICFICFVLFVLFCFVLFCFVKIVFVLVFCFYMKVRLFEISFIKWIQTQKSIVYKKYYKLLSLWYFFVSRLLYFNPAI